MKYGVFIKYLAILVILLSILPSCKKKEPAPGKKNETAEQIPKELYGTWHMMNSTYQYWEFIEGKTDSFYNMLQQNMRYKQLEYCRITADSIQFANAWTYAYTVTADKLVMKKDGSMLSFERADNSLVNHTNWQTQVKVLKTISLPRGFYTDYYVRNFGINGDTIYYWNKDGRMMSYNMLTNEYLDSFRFHKIITSCISNPPLFYYYSGDIAPMDSVWKSSGFNKNLQYVDFKNIRGTALSMDRQKNVFYLHDYEEMKWAPEGGSMLEMSWFNVIYCDAVIHYRDDKFITRAGWWKSDNLSIMDYNGHGWVRQKSYDVIPGHDVIGPISTDGLAVWVCARNNKSMQYELIQLRLD